jgi:hypothetical protein
MRAEREFFIPVMPEAAIWGFPAFIRCCKNALKVNKKITKERRVNNFLNISITFCDFMINHEQMIKTLFLL